MPFPVDEKYILESESNLNVRFPIEFKTRMMDLNGGEWAINEYVFELYPFFDKSDKKRISRTCNHIELETKNAQDWEGFPENGIAIGTDGFGNYILLTHHGNGMLSDEIYFWNHETRQIHKIAESINKLDIEKTGSTNSYSSLWQRFKSRFDL